jgi:hypothetical protein
VRITARLVFALCLAVVVVVGGFTALQIRQERAGLERDLQRRAALLAEGLKEAVAPVLSGGGRSTAPVERILKRFGRPNQLVAVYDQIANPIAVVPEDARPRVAALPEVIESLSTSAVRPSRCPASPAASTGRRRRPSRRRRSGCAARRCGRRSV